MIFTTTRRYVRTNQTGASAVCLGLRCRCLTRYRIRCYTDTVSGVKSGKEPWRWVYYKSSSGRVPVREFIDDQEEKVREKVEGRNFWELRTKLGGDIYRTFYFARTGKKFVLVHAIQKKSRKTPKKELEMAEERMNDYLERTEKRRRSQG